MLNTRSCWTAGLIWLAIALILGSVLWSAADWPPPSRAWLGFADSELGESLRQFQTLIAGIVGFGILALAYWLNGYQQRQTETRLREQEARTLAHALMLETERLEADCDAAAARFASLAEEADRRRGEEVVLSAGQRALLQRASAGGRLLAGLGPRKLTPLGTNASTAVLMLRGAVADLEREAASLDEREGGTLSAADIRALARACAAVCLKCARARPLLSTLSRHGTTIADERDPAAMPTSAEIDAQVAAASRATQPSATVLAGPRPVAKG